MFSHSLIKPLTFHIFKNNSVVLWVDPWCPINCVCGWCGWFLKYKMLLSYSGARPPKDPSAELPHFSSPHLVNKYALVESLDFLYYLRHGRPSFAFGTFLVQQLATSKNLASQWVRLSLCPSSSFSSFASVTHQLFSLTHTSQFVPNLFWNNTSLSKSLREKNVNMSEICSRMLLAW